MLHKQDVIFIELNAHTADTPARKINVSTISFNVSDLPENFDGMIEETLPLMDLIPMTCSQLGFHTIISILGGAADKDNGRLKLRFTLGREFNTYEKISAALVLATAMVSGSEYADNGLGRLKEIE